MKIYLIRHGETDWNHINRFQGREDIELNAAGIAQAVRCGQTLQGLGIEAVYTSPLKRAHCTGEEIAAQIGLSRDGVEPVSYTHLDVYKRQGEYRGIIQKYPCHWHHKPARNHNRLG